MFSGRDYFVAPQGHAEFGSRMEGLAALFWGFVEAGPRKWAGGAAGGRRQARRLPNGSRAHSVEDGHDIRGLQERLGGKEGKTTMVHTHAP